MVDPTVTPRTIYDRLGGRPTFESAVHALYTYITPRPHLIGYFPDSFDFPQQRQHLTNLLVAAAGGPNEYKGRSLREAHAHLNIAPAHYAEVAGVVLRILAEAGADPDIIYTFATVLVGAEKEIVAQTPATAASPPARWWQRWLRSAA